MMSENLDLDTMNKILYNKDILIYIYTKKIQAFKSIVEALKEVFKDVPLRFSPRVEKQSENDPTKKKVTGGMTITAFNTNSNILVRLNLDADGFGFYKCEPDNQKKCVSLGVNMSNLFKLIKFLNNDDELHIIYNKNSLNKLNLQYVSKFKRLTSDYYLNLLDLKDENIMIGKQNYDFVISMPSGDFHSLIKNMSTISDKVNIIFNSNNNNYSLIFKCGGEFASQISEFNGSTSQNENNGNTINVTKNEEDIDEPNNNIVQGEYELKALSLFSRCQTMCPVIELYIKNVSPLIIKYRIADMGTVHLIISPLNSETLNNNGDSEENENDSDNEEKN